MADMDNDTAEDMGAKVYVVHKTVKVEAENIAEAAKIARYMKVPQRNNITVLETSESVIEIDDDEASLTK